MVIFLLGSWSISIPVKVNCLIFLLPKGYFTSSWRIFSSKNELPPQMPSSTCRPRIPSRFPVFGWRKMNWHGSKGLWLNPNRMSSSEMAEYQRNGASTNPYAPFSSLHTSFVLSCSAWMSSFTGSMASTRSFWGLPCKKAAFISKDCNCHPIEAINCSNNIFAFRPSVGESLGNSSNFGSKYPKITNLALALTLLGSAVVDCLSSSTGFQVRIHLHRRICSWGTFSRRIRDTIPVLSQFCTSVSFAFWNCSFSCALSVDIFTSDLCFLAADTTNAISVGSVSSCHVRMSSAVTSTSHLHARSSSSATKHSSVSMSTQCRPSQMSSSSALSSGMGVLTAGSSSVIPSRLLENGMGWCSCWISCVGVDGCELVDGISGSTSGWPSEGLTLGGDIGFIWGGLWAFGIMGISVGSGMARVIPWVFIWGICCAIIDTDGSLWVIGMFFASMAETGLTCSGAHLNNLLACVVHMVWEFSWTTIFIGPAQNPSWAPLPWR